MSDSFSVRKIPITCIDYSGDYMIQGGVSFKDCLYVGMITLNEEDHEGDLIRILCYSKSNRSWEVVYTAPFKGCEEPGTRDFIHSGPATNFIFMETLALPEGNDEHLMVGIGLGSQSRLLHTIDGIDFHELELGVESGPGPRRILDLQSFDAHLVTALLFSQATGKSGTVGNLVTDLYLLEDPENETWRSLDFPGITDPQWQMIQGITVLNEHIYVAVADSRCGFHLWKTHASGNPAWEKVLEQGALRYTRNKGLSAMTVFQDNLYLATDAPLVWEKGTEAPSAEIIKVFQDGRWDLIVGEPRFSPVGLKVPLAVMGPGFDENANTSITGLSVYDNLMFASSQHPSPSSETSEDGWISWDFNLWQSADGEEWECCLARKFEDDIDLLQPRTIQPLPFGLMITGFFAGEGETNPALWILNRNE